MFSKMNKVNPWDYRTFPSRFIMAKYLRQKAMRTDDFDTADRLIRDAEGLEAEAKVKGDLIVSF